MDVILISGDGIKRTNMVQRFVGPYKLAHYLRKEGYSCQVVDFATRMTQDELERAVRRFITPGTLMIGLSTTFIAMDTYPHPDGQWRHLPAPLLAALTSIRGDHPGIRFVAGGYLSERLPDYGVIDHTVQCYGGPATEDLLLDYVRWLRGRGDEPHGVMHQPGFGGRPRPWYSQPRRQLYSIQLDDFRFTHQDCVLPGEPLPLDTSRGCIFSCRFCRFQHLGRGRLDYLRGFDRIRDELVHNHDSFGTTRYYLLDDTFNDSTYKVAGFHGMVGTLGFGISYAAYIRADLVHRFPDTAHQLRESGLVAAQHGIETLDPLDAQLIGKGWSGRSARDYIPRLYHDIWQRGVNQHLSFIVGLPNSTQQEVHDTVDWFVENRLDSAMFFALSVMVPGEHNVRSTTSEFDRRAREHGFTFEQLPGGGQQWRNARWSETEAERVAEQARQRCRQHNRINSWDSMPLRWYGMPQHEVLTRRHRDMDHGWIRQRGQDMVSLYLERLMSL